MIRDIGDENLTTDKTTYIPVPEDKKPEIMLMGVRFQIEAEIRRKSFD